MLLLLPKNVRVYYRQLYSQVSFTTIINIVNVKSARSGTTIKETDERERFILRARARANCLIRDRFREILTSRANVSSENGNRRTSWSTLGVIMTR